MPKVPKDKEGHLRAERASSNPIASLWQGWERINMPRPLQRVRLENGLKLDLNNLGRRGFVRRGVVTGPIGITWTSSYWGEIASGVIWANMADPSNGWFRIKIGQLDQRIYLATRRRHFGGRQWYFACPYTNRLASVLWKPPGARDFACRQRWGPRIVAYGSQFLDPDNRAHQGQAKINSRLCATGGFDPDEWKFPPKPKWMRWRTYNRAEEKFDRYEAILDYGCGAALARLMGRYGV
jgi:hypothetical protein